MKTSRYFFNFVAANFENLVICIGFCLIVGLFYFILTHDAYKCYA